MHALDEHVHAGDQEPVAVVDDGGVVTPRAGPEVWPDALEEAELAETAQAHAVSIARRRRAACSGSGASLTARMTQARRTPAAMSCPRLDSSTPPRRAAEASSRSRDGSASGVMT